MGRGWPVASHLNLILLPDGLSITSGNRVTEVRRGLAAERKRRSKETNMHIKGTVLGKALKGNLLSKSPLLLLPSETSFSVIKEKSRPYYRLCR